MRVPLALPGTGRAGAQLALGYQVPPGGGSAHAACCPQHGGRSGVLSALWAPSSRYLQTSYFLPVR